MGQITVSGTGTATGTPDTATLHIGIKTERKKTVDARKINNAISKTVKDICKDRFGIKDRDILAPGPQVYPNWDREAKEIVCYMATANIAVKIRNLDHVDDLIDAITYGYTPDGVDENSISVSGVKFDIENKDEMLDEARVRAFNDARDKAQLYAQAAGIELGELGSLSETGHGDYSSCHGAVALSAGPRAGSDVESGETDVQVLVQAVYKIN